ncbi:ganglioside-induced differentiation-associated protein 2-like [Helianthus annuus]|uniref:ganglioside-induced differentiation-associated protein 2-like n=1 Tax=Helianthus annuus TaxID=4232 RepID=UPI000B8FCD7B|nr:ganglioside-induced differentiation-associated protein 2-like [Helianthus annuus]
MYKRLLPLYFPLDKKEEEIAISKLPADVGDENGETVIDERKIRIKPLQNVKNTFPKIPRASLDVPVGDQGLARQLVTCKTHNIRGSGVDSGCIRRTSL